MRRFLPIPLEDAKSLLRYNSDTGRFFWAKARGPNRKGDPAGYMNSGGYISIRIHGKDYPAHRIAWAIFYGEDPVIEIDHINRIRSDNRIDNLRLAFRDQNSQNGPRRVNNSSGYKGVSFNKSRGLWRAQIMKSGKKRNLGDYPTRELAHAVYCRAAQDLHGDFWRAV